VIRRIVLALAAVLPVAAASQEAAPPMPENPRAPRFNEVERGLFTGLEVGYLRLFKTPPAGANFANAGQSGGAADGLLVGATVGYDVTPRIALSLYALGGNESASVSYGGFSVLSAGGDVRVSLFGLRDSSQVERLFFYVHGRAGYLLTYPSGLFGRNDTYLAGGPGLEYFTHLRHFSIGLAADVAYAVSAKSAGIALTPTMRYTF